MQKSDFNMTPFSASEPRRPRQTRYDGAAVRAWNRRRNAFQSRAGSMVAKIGICMAILACVILIQVFILEERKEEPIVQTSADASDQTGTGSESGDVLGKLRFVSAGGVKSVFNVSQRWDLPVQSSLSELMDDDTMLCLNAKAGDEVAVSASGEVKAIAKDETYGEYVRINHGSDLESIYYNLSDVCVEVGQPLLAKDTLGKVGADGKLYVVIMRTGEKLNPATFLDVEP